MSTISDCKDIGTREFEFEFEFKWGDQLKIFKQKNVKQ